jgi:hypothetical protein
VGLTGGETDGAPGRAVRVYAAGNAATEASPRVRTQAVTARQQEGQPPDEAGREHRHRPGVEGGGSPGGPHGPDISPAADP